MKNKTSEIPFEYRWQNYLLSLGHITAKFFKFTLREFTLPALTAKKKITPEEIHSHKWLQGWGYIISPATAQMQMER